jgi:hypothetical protein
LAEWPTPPQDDEDRQRREELYWNREFAKYLIEDGTGEPRLRPKQEIINAWFWLEKWHFRNYYAATGVVQRSVYTHDFIDKRGVLEKYKHVKSWNTRNITQQSAMAEHEKATEFLKNFDNNVVPQHIEKWGGWYFFHVEQAYKKAFAPSTRKFAKPSGDL